MIDREKRTIFDEMFTMKYLLIFTLSFCVVVNCLHGQSFSVSDSIVSITKYDFDQGKLFSTKRYIDKNIVKRNGKLVVSKGCKAFVDITTPKDEGEYYQYDYAGDLDKELRFKVVKETNYNGEEFHILDMQRNCVSHYLLGEPQVFGSVIVNINTSMTTDKEALIEIWKIKNDGIKKVRTLKIGDIKSKNGWIDVKVMKLSHNRKIMFKDFSEKYWMIEYTLPK